MEQQDQEQDRIMTLLEVARYLRVSDTTIRRLILKQQHRIPSFRVGRVYRFRRGEIDRWSGINERGGIE